MRASATSRGGRVASDCWRLFAVAAFVGMPGHRVEGGEPAYEVVWTRVLESGADEYAGQIVVDTRGVTRVCGETYGALGESNAGAYDAFVAQLDADGEVVWLNQFGSSTGDACSSVVMDLTGRVLATGTTYGLLGASDPSPMLPDAFVTRLDVAGQSEAMTQLGSPLGTRCWAAVMAPSNHLYICGDVVGSLGGTAFGSGDGFVVKLNLDGSIAWARQVGTPAWDNALSVAVDGNGNVFITGFTFGALVGANAGSTDIYIAKFNSAGDLLWTRQVGTPATDDPAAILTDGDGSVYLTGLTHGAIGGTNAGYADAIIVKYAPDGTLLWARQFGTNSIDRPRSLAIVDSGNVLVAGYTFGSLAAPNAGYGDPFLAMFNDSGSLLWMQQFGTTASEGIESIALSADESLFISGTSCVVVDGKPGDCDVYVSKLVPITLCVGDVTGDQNVNAADLVQVLMHWGPCPPPPVACDADTNDDDVVDVNDLLNVLNNWGPC